MEMPVQEQWMEVAELGEFAETDRKQVELGEGQQVGLFKLGETEFAAISIWCSHEKTTLMPGDIEDGAIQCPLHGARFDLRTGKNLSFPAVKPVLSYEVKVEGEKVYVKVESATATGA